MFPVSRTELNAMLFARGLQRPDYVATNADIMAVWFRLYDDVPAPLKIRLTE